MTNFVHCRGCGHQIHETAPTCPKCGAPQVIAAQAAPSAMAPLASSLASYGPIPWYRQRWALICIFLLFAPAVAVIAWTGELYYIARGTVKTFPKSVKVVITGMAIFLLIAAGSDEEALQGFAGMLLIGMAIGLSLRK
ncbi:zinc ribbon domain-containing protein [Variovorax sp. OV700]|uniref:zinc ribbon domain-containing protein n=1 Tax=Variovorax sp. OV700 TaxID=1882826 RepID=UPI000891D575|nr:zinc ribbon domain-containing protein [Variovorax sp. OV700]SDI59282.1 hypothetical protein SAMN05444748_10615 [Variovorax sp. OV700]